MLQSRDHYSVVVLQHANLNKPVSVVAGTIAMWHWSDTTKSTHVYTTGGVFPAKETPEEITKLIKTLGGKDVTK
jgi:hypothetical protein